jgi:hypothetical protein
VITIYRYHIKIFRVIIFMSFKTVLHKSSVPYKKLTTIQTAWHVESC